MSVRRFFVPAIAVTALFLSPCSRSTQPEPKKVKAPLGLPAVPVPADNPPTAETIALGRRLNYDPQFSVDNTVGALKTPSRRNVAQTTPYMHDGILNTLKDVIDLYVGGGNSSPWCNKDIKSLEKLTRRERDDLVAFLEALTGEFPPNVGKS